MSLQTASGNSVSSTITLNVHVEALPAASVIVHVTGVVPTGNADPEAIVATSVPIVQFSV